MSVNHVSRGVCSYSTDSSDFAYPWKAFCALWSNIWRADKNPSVASKQLRGLTLSKRGFYFPTVSTSCVYFIELFSSHSGAQAAISRRKCISRLINTGCACLEHVASFFRDTCERVWRRWRRPPKSLFLIFRELFIVFSPLQHHMRGLEKLMNYPHRGQDSMCKLHYPTSHNMERFKFIELKSWIFPHWSDPVQDCTQSPFSVIKTTVWKSSKSLKSEISLYLTESKSWPHSVVFTVTLQVAGYLKKQTF